MGHLYTKAKKIAYKLLDLLIMGNGMPVRFKDFKLKLPAKYFRLFPADYERSSFRFFIKHAKPGDMALDIGAHIGLYSVFFSKLTAGKVYSFEPTPSTSAVLRKTIKINNCEKDITVIQAAVAEKAGVATFYSNDIDVSTSNSLLDLKLSDSANRRGAYQVDIVSIDGFRAANNLSVNILKIDAEGVELEVLNGAKETFLQDRPVAIIGLHPFAYPDRIAMLERIWDKLTEYKMQVQIAGQDITKEHFCNRSEPVFDAELIPY